MSDRLSIAALFKGLFFSLAVLLLFALIFSLFAYLLDVKNDTLLLVSNIALATSIFSGGFIAARKAGKKGLHHGIAIGIFFLVLIVILTLIWGNFSWGVFIEKAGLTLLAGIIGGILGVR